MSRTGGGEAAAQIRDPVLQEELLSRCATIFALDPGSRDGAAPRGPGYARFERDCKTRTRIQFGSGVRTASRRTVAGTFRRCFSEICTELSRWTSPMQLVPYFAPPTRRWGSSMQLPHFRLPPALAGLRLLLRSYPRSSATRNRRPQAPHSHSVSGLSSRNAPCENKMNNVFCYDDVKCYFGGCGELFGAFGRHRCCCQFLEHPVGRAGHRLPLMADFVAKVRCKGLSWRASLSAAT